MVTRPLSTSITRSARPGTQMRSGTVLDVIAPTVDEAGVETGWQVLLQMDGGQVRQAGVASTYNPIPGDVVAITSYLNTLFVIDKVAAGQSGIEPGGRVDYGFQQTTGTYRTGTVSAEVELSTDLNRTFLARNGAAYHVTLFTGYSNAAAPQWAFFRLRQNAFNSGIDIGEYFRQGVPVATVVYGFRGKLQIRNDTGQDFTVTIVPTLSSPAGGAATAFCTANTRAFTEVTVAGSSKLWPHAAPLTIPPDLS